MCLVLKDGDLQPKIAEADLDCYKVVINIGDSYYTYFRSFKIKLDSGYTGELGKPELNNVSRLVIRRGFHTFVNFEDAKKFVENNFDACSMRVIKAVIPKGSRYYEGLFYSLMDVKAPSYASDVIDYSKIIY